MEIARLLGKSLAGIDKVFEEEETGKDSAARGLTGGEEGAGEETREGEAKEAGAGDGEGEGEQKARACMTAFASAKEMNSG